MQNNEICCLQGNSMLGYKNQDSTLYKSYSLIFMGLIKIRLVNNFDMHFTIILISLISFQTEIDDILSELESADFGIDVSHLYILIVI